MVRANRRRRAAEKDLYAGCRAGQDCLDDIKQKFEQNTVADRILKWLSSFIYLGNLGISTGRGSGGGSGYVPIGSGGRTVRPAMGGQPSRPNIVVENVGPAEVPVGGTIDASAPSVITPSESTVVVEGATTSHEEIPLVPLHPDVGAGGPDPSLPVAPPVDVDGPAVLDVSLDVTSTYPHDPSIVNPGSETLSTQLPSQFERPGTSPLFPTVSLQPLDVSLLPGETSFPPHTVINLSGTFEEIELDVLGNTLDSEPLYPQTSTPKSRLDTALTSVRRAYNRRTDVLRKYYHRLTQQIQVKKPEFLQGPSQLVSYEFSNQAFDPDTTLFYSQSTENVVTAPDTDFQDIGTLHRPVYSIEGEHIRVSRFGERETIRTRSGATIGAKVHFYTDLSSISHLADTFTSGTTLDPDIADPGIELHLFGESTEDTSIAHGQGGGIQFQNGEMHTETQFIDVSNGSLHSEYSDSMLMDTYSETFSNAHLALLNSDSSAQLMSIPELARPVRELAESTGGLSVLYPVNGSVDLSTSSPSFIDNKPIPPFIFFLFSHGDPSFFLHPSLLRKKRKRVFY
ncbi:L2 [Tursiops truncatus papillomavirus 5]|uniref:Minor capsid protein L2 n=1 Tax=Tursiops truncatus papillomavirus 5 TaxID=1144381 RepID=H6UYP3_PSPV|nr:L2 [Tursiops truncatus papillomavirus 5]